MKPKHFIIFDFETFYSKEYSLRRLSVPEYLLDPRYETIMMAVYIPPASPQIILPHDIPAFLEQYPAAETVACSHNALFDLSILSWKYGWVAGTLLDSLGMTRSLRRYKRYSLEACVKELFGREMDKSQLGRVIGMNAQQIKQAGLWGPMCTYAMNDARECWHIFQKLAPEFPVEEMRVMDLVLRCAVVPRLYADVPMLEKHLEELQHRKSWLLRESGYEKAALMSTASFQEALESLGVDVATKISATGRRVPAFAKADEFMTELLEYADSPDDDINYAVQTLAAARLSQKSTIEETRAERFLSIGRLPWGNGPLLPVALRYGGAHTGRLSGEWRLNMQNLPRDKTKSKLRAAVTAKPDEKLVTGDLAQIEARIVAVLAGQGALVEAFRNGDDVYAKFASIVFGRTITKKDQPHERFIGKTAILGLGYGCGHERFYRMVVAQARQYGIPLEGLFDLGTAEVIVRTYRSLFNRIPMAWSQLDVLLAHIINSHNTTQFSRWPDANYGPLTFKSGRVILPNRMPLLYTIGDPDLWGGVLFENIAQALARIVIMQAALRLNKLGLRMVLQSHDELVFGVEDDKVEEAKQIVLTEMTRTPVWLPELPLAVEIGVGQNYSDTK